MSIVVGFGPDTQSGAGVRFGAELARSTGEPLVLVCVVPNAFADRSMSDFAGVSAGFKEYLESATGEAIATARAAVPEDVDAEVVTRVGRSIPKVLTAESVERDAQVLVVGSAVSGRLGRIGLGSTTNRLVHSSALPVALTPRGFTTSSSTVRRLVFATGASGADLRLAGTVARLARWLGVPITLVTFAVRPSAHSSFGTFFDQGTYQQWESQARGAQAAVAEAVGDAARAAGSGDTSGGDSSSGDSGLGNSSSGNSDAAQAAGPTSGTAGRVVSTEIAVGERWSQAMDAFEWQDGDVLAVGSSENAWTGVFLGTTATHIMRHTPVPMFLLPNPKG